VRVLKLGQATVYMELKQRCCLAGISRPEVLVECIEGALEAVLYPRLGIGDELHPCLAGSGPPPTNTPGAPLPDDGPDPDQGPLPRSVRQSGM
jgi:hypothetical protein